MDKLSSKLSQFVSHLSNQHVFYIGHHSTKLPWLLVILVHRRNGRIRRQRRRRRRQGGRPTGTAQGAQAAVAEAVE